MNKFVLLFVLLAVFMAAIQCSDSDFKIHETGLAYKFVNENKDARQAKVNDVVALKMKYTDASGILIEETDLFRIQLKQPSHAGGAVEDAIMMMHEGDSAIFLINAENYYTKSRGVKLPARLKPDENLTFYIKLIDVISADEFAKERHVARLSDEREEERLMKEFLERTNITVEPTNSGLYFQTLQAGDGKSPVPGKNVTVHYMGYFIDGQLFDSSYKRNVPFTFRLGAGQVIQGWDEGVSMMHVGGKYKLVIPSYLAYGSKATGSIPPNTTLVFEIELLSAE
jgi:peptidylprolyl isomerase